jgi:DNA-binding XRE family transcriptional regulator
MSANMTAVAIEVRADQSRWEGLTRNQQASLLLAALDATGVSQTDLMKKLDVSWTTVSRWANAHSPISWARWVSICSVLHLPTSWEPEPTKRP